MHEQAVNAADLDALVGLFDQEARVLLQDGSPLNGRDAIRQAYAGLFAQDLSQFVLQTRSASEVGDIAFLSCS